MKNKHYSKLFKGFISGITVSTLANLITFDSFEIYNILVGGVIGIIIYYVFHS